MCFFSPRPTESQREIVRYDLTPLLRLNLADEALGKYDHHASDRKERSERDDEAR